MNIINRIIEPQRLILAWQPHREVDPTRTRRAIGEILKDQYGQYVFRYLTGTEDYKIARGFCLEHYIPFTEEKEYRGDFVLDCFTKRLPSRSRRDFGNFLKSLCIDPDSDISDFALLGYSGCYLPSDNFSIVNTFENITGRCQFLLEVAGFGYYKEWLTEIGIGMKIDVSAEPNNEWDNRAIMFSIKGQKIGNVNRLMLTSFHHWLKKGIIEATVEKIEGSFDRPRVFVFVSIDCY